MNKVELMERIENVKTSSAWNKGVKIYALEMLEGLNDEGDLVNITLLKKGLLNGADDWRQYSEGGCALIYNCDIAERLCSPSDLKRSRNGEKEPNNHENWIDVQARALYQAFILIRRLYNR